MTSLASASGRSRIVIVSTVFRVGLRTNQRSKRQKCFFAQMPLFRDHGSGALRFQHPDRNLQSPPTWVQNANGPVTSLRSAKDPQSCTMKRVKGVEDLNIRIVRAQGIVGVGVITRTFISLFRAAGSHLMVKAGSPAGRDFFCRSRCCRRCFAASSCTTSRRRSPPAR